MNHEKSTNEQEREFEHILTKLVIGALGVFISGVLLFSFVIGSIVYVLGTDSDSATQSNRITSSAISTAHQENPTPDQRNQIATQIIDIISNAQGIGMANLPGVGISYEEIEYEVDNIPLIP